MSELERDLDAIAVETGFSGVFRVDPVHMELARAYGLADRGYDMPNAIDTRFALASGTRV